VACSGIGVMNNAPMLRGFYNPVNLRPIADALVPSIDVRLANNRVGRRVIIDSRGALTIEAGRLQWWSLTGKPTEPVPHQSEAIEAVIDSAGCVVVYLDSSQSLHWLDCKNPGSDEDLRIHGSAPALSGDGRYLAYLNDGLELEVYDRAQRKSISGLLEGKIESFAIGGGSLFASTSVAGLVEMNLETGEVSDLVPILPEIASTNPLGFRPCGGTFLLRAD